MLVKFFCFDCFSELKFQMLLPLSWSISLTVSLSYLFFYTAYDKQTKQLSRDLLVTVLTCGKSVDHTIVEANKLISLAGLTILLLAGALPSSAATLQYELAWHGMIMLWMHTVYSVFKFYGTDNIPSLKRLSTTRWALAFTPAAERTVLLRTISCVLGSIAQLLLSFTLSAFGLVLGVAHFWTMEVDYKWKLQVRPWAFLPFVIFVALLLKWGLGLW
jgi:hypothetical protein